MKKQFIPFLAMLLIMFCFGVKKDVCAFIIEDLNLASEGDIIMGPGKTEVLMEAGNKYSKEMIITNRTGHTKIFNISVEDFRGSRDPQDQSVQFLGTEKGPYSLRDYIIPETADFTLKHGQRMRMQIEIDVPKDAEPGGLYGAVMVSASNIPEEGEIQKDAAKGQLMIVTRLASLFFVRVKGDVLENSVLKDFKADKPFYEAGPVSLFLSCENNGSVHVSPYGLIEVKNIFGKKIDEIEIDPWYVMPDSLRTREIKWSKNMLFGKYTVNLSLNRGYQDIIDKKTISVWIIPWKIVAAISLVLIIIIWLLVWFISRLEIKVKPKQIEQDISK